MSREGQLGRSLLFASVWLQSPSPSSLEHKHARAIFHLTRSRVGMFVRLTLSAIVELADSMRQLVGHITWRPVSIF